MDKRYEYIQLPTGTGKPPVFPSMENRPQTPKDNNQVDNGNWVEVPEKKIVEKESIEFDFPVKVEIRWPYKWSTAFGRSVDENGTVWVEGTLSFQFHRVVPEDVLDEEYHPGLWAFDNKYYANDDSLVRAIKKKVEWKVRKILDENLIKDLVSGG